jgi:hypothetical protein
MGRTSDPAKDTTEKLVVRRVPLDSGGYDPGGAYWGIPNNLFCVIGPEGETFYTRARDKAAVKAMFPKATWGR